MAMDSSYDWHTGSAAGTSWLKPWMVLALVLSAGVHGCLYYWFTQHEVPSQDAPTREAIETTKNFKLDQVALDIPDPASEMKSSDAADKANLTKADIQPFVKETDPYELQKELPDIDIRLKPGEELPPLPGKGGAEGPASIASVLAQDSAELNAELDRLTKRMMTKAPPASEKQMILNTGDSDTELLDDEALLKSYNDTLAKLSTAGSDVTQGFSDLDELLTRTGPILDETKPILMPTDLLFGFNEDSLQESARLSLMKLGLLIQKNPDSTFIIEGHTDTTGSEEYNLQLSKRRAESVSTWLTSSLSLSSERLKTKAYGETKPLANPTGSKQEQAINRRVEIVIRPPKKSS